MYKTICSKLNDNNYNHYEISNFSKKGYESKHNKTYWNNEEYYGFGLGASSYIKNKRITNTRSINKYNRLDFINEIENIDKSSDIEYQIILNLRKKEGINLINFKNKYNVDLKEIYDYNYLVNNKLLIEEDDNLFIPEDKWYVSNEIITEVLNNEKV